MYLLIENNLKSDSRTTRDRNEDDFISDLLQRQDAVLASLDELNSRIEKAISDIGKAREESNDLAEQPAADADEPKKVELPVPKAA